MSFSRVDSPPRIHSPLLLMDSQDTDSAVAPAQPLHHHLQPLQHHHINNMLVVGPSQNQPHLLQHQQPPSVPNSYQGFHPGPLSVSAAAANNTMLQQNQQLQNQQQSRYPIPFSSMVNSAPPQLRVPMDYSDSGNVTSPPTDGGGGGGGGGIVVGSGSGVEGLKRKRGRPRKYPVDGTAASGGGIATGLLQNPTTVAVTKSGGGGGAGDTFPTEPPAKKQRGRPPGSGKKQLEALGVPGFNFTPHLILVQAGEDIASKIIDFSRKVARTICILTANGAVANVTLRQPSFSGTCNVVTHEGVFEIVSLAGSFLVSENNEGVGRTGGLSIALSRGDGTVLGGGVAGLLKAASTVQIIVASFMLDQKKSKSMPAIVPLPTMLSFANAAAATDASPPSQGGSGGGGGSSNSSDDNGSQLDQGGAYINAGQAMQNVVMYPSWGNNTMNMHQN